MAAGGRLGGYLHSDLTARRSVEAFRLSGRKFTGSNGFSLRNAVARLPLASPSTSLVMVSLTPQRRPLGLFAGA